jgi:hypothetical protein
MSHDEGYIKFECFWEKADWDPAIEFNELIAFRNEMHKHKLIGIFPDGIGYGNISQRISAKTFIISGSATGGVSNADKEQFSKVKKFLIDKNQIHCRGPVKASSESLSHAAIYSSCAEVNFVLHVHNYEVWKKEKGILPSTDQSAAYGTPEMANSILNLLSNSPKAGIIIMTGHEEGILIFGPNPIGVKELLKQLRLI